ncbi:DNA adenine methylase [Nocardia kruczakiae]|uniref:DNA adenine methylase n=1 Tax=Nocardia kruczakiae TaxID=261477 RepID=UPI000A00FA88|nr:Dam family site-specific DNA-(adenine-N6)-methyltransferase [Nocardia kruczakiae]
MNYATDLVPIIRWVGGKRWLVPTIKKLLSDTPIVNYHEPFLGGAAVFINMRFSKTAYLSDSNSELIEMYDALRDNHERVFEHLIAHANSADHYYKTRQEIPGDPINRAARFLYLNHTSFNGIYRVNLRGIYNVPFGYRKNPQIPSLDALKLFAERLQRACLNAQDFGECIENVGPGDLIYLDPPYTVAHNNNGFIKYNQTLFSWDDQKRLSELIDQIKQIGAYYILSNAAHPSIETLFEKGDRMISTSRRNSIGGRSAARGSASEYVFTNLGAI